MDASVVADALWADGGPASETLKQAGLPLAAPYVVDIEIASVFRRLLLAGSLTDADARELLSRLDQLPLDRYAHRELMPRIWELRHQVTPYDAAYVALAESLGAALLTADGRLARAHGIRCEVRLVG